MTLKHNIIIDKHAIDKNLNRLLNQVYKLLPEREEHLNWKKHLESIILEFTGINNLLIDQQDIIFQILSKLESLYSLEKDTCFSLFRKTIFECISLINVLRGLICMD